MNLTIAKCIVLLIFVGIIITTIFNLKSKKTELGSFENPEIALLYTQKTLTSVSIQLNRGMKSVIQIQEYELAKNKIFKEK
ncbi:hypothetical protein SLW70_08195 [Flavobacterium sp. NG2]|uniref:hypothetical protein n=1 Tax=Flavobacterium sp. NG2 TaxID=3097547 RepID=UPI002A82447F|nr:hypothetical protein [Flavobacterium sp. NG2]WPR73086.1 hypothetical protein SLW70_08195 [Flavobacterium sp. NG2]